MKRALVCGIGGQDGAYLAALLLGKGYQVFGTSRDAQLASFSNLEHLGIRQRVTVLSMSPTDFRSVFSAVRASNPDEIYFLAAQSSVGLSFEQPVEALQSITFGTLNLLESIRFVDRPIRFYHASSSECFGDIGRLPATESTPFRPRSPYAVAKASAHWLVANYREAYGIHASNGILFNHESPLRPERFVTQKIIRAARRIAAGSGETLQLGRLDIVRDWGWAPEYVQAMWLMVQRPQADDFIVATGKAHSLEDFVAATFSHLGLDWHDHVRSDPRLFRPTDLEWSQGDASKAAAQLLWAPTLQMGDVIREMLAAPPRGGSSA